MQRNLAYFLRQPIHKVMSALSASTFQCQVVNVLESGLIKT